MADTSGSLGSVGSVSVDVTADASDLDVAFRELPRKAQKGLEAMEQSIRASMVRNRLALKSLDSGGDPYAALGNASKIQAITSSQDQLKAKLEALLSVKQRMTAANQQLADSNQRLMMSEARAIGAAEGNAAVRASSVHFAKSGGNVNGGGSPRGGGKMGYRLQQLGQAADDLQYVGQAGMGIRPIVNNLMQLSAPLGILAIAADQVFRNWGDLKKSFDDTTPIGKAMRALEGFAEKIGLIDKEAEKLAKNKAEREKAYQDITGIKGKGVAERGSAISDAVGSLEGGGNEAIDILVKKMSEGAKFDADQIKLAREQAAKLLADASEGKESAVKELMAKSRGTKLGFQIEENSPERKAAAERSADESRKAAEESERLKHEADAERDRVRRLGEDIAGKQSPAFDKALIAGNGGAERDRIAAALAASGKTPDEANRIADSAVRTAVEKLDAAIRDKMVNGQASTYQQGARLVNAEAEDKRQALMKKPDTRIQISDVAGYLNSIQSEGVKKPETAVESAIKENTKETAKVASNTAKMLTLREKRGYASRAAGDS